LHEGWNFWPADDQVCQQLSHDTKDNLISFCCRVLQGDLSTRNGIINGKLLDKRAKRKDHQLAEIIGKK
jgi:hypothetical protein